MVDFLIKSTISLGVLYLIYTLVLSRLKTFNFNRYFLLGSLIFSLTLPFVSIPIDNNVVPPVATASIQIITESIEQTSEFITTSNGNGIVSTDLFLYIYASISLALFIRFGLNLFNISKTISTNQIARNQNYSIVLVNEKLLPHTFFNNILVNKYDYQDGRIDEKLIQHEMTHASQLHSFDIVFIELLKVFWWINPFVWLMKKQIQLNHEYLADNSVLANHNIHRYKEMLINMVLDNNNGKLVSNFNFSLTKQRLNMMSKHFSKTQAIVNHVFAVVVVVFLAVSLTFSQGKDIDYKLLIDGKSGDYEKVGLQHTDFASMKITTDKRKIKVEKLQATLARGKRPIEIKQIHGDQIGLTSFLKRARKGDRIVIEIKELSDKKIELTQHNSIVTIPILFDE